MRDASGRAAVEPLVMGALSGKERIREGKRAAKARPRPGKGVLEHFDGREWGGGTMGHWHSVQRVSAAWNAANKDTYLGRKKELWMEGRRKADGTEKGIFDVGDLRGFSGRTNGERIA